MVNFALSHDQVLTLLRKCRNSEKWFEDGVIWSIQYFLLRRISEVTHLRIEHILPGGVILFHDTKTGDVEIPAPKWILEDLRKIIGSRHQGFIFRHRGKGSKYGEESVLARSTMNDRLRKACREFLGIESFLGYRSFKMCDKCPGKTDVHPKTGERGGPWCKFNKFSWCQLVSWKKCERQGRPIGKKRLHLIHTHVLRASAATFLVNVLGFPERQVMQWGGWHDQNAFRKYVVHRGRGDLLEAWRMADQFDGKRITILDLYREILELKSDIRKMRDQGSAIPISEVWKKIPGQLSLEYAF